MQYHHIMIVSTIVIVVAMKLHCDWTIRQLFKVG